MGDAHSDAEGWLATSRSMHFLAFGMVWTQNLLRRRSCSSLSKRGKGSPRQYLEAQRRRHMIIS